MCYLNQVLLIEFAERLGMAATSKSMGTIHWQQLSVTVEHKTVLHWISDTGIMIAITRDVTTQCKNTVLGLRLLKNEALENEAPNVKV